MIKYQILDPKKSDHYFIQLNNQKAKDAKKFNGFKAFNNKLYKSDFKLLDELFDCKNIIFFSDSGSVIAACTHYKPNADLLAQDYFETLGNFLFADQISNEQLKNCGQTLQKLFNTTKIILPLNGSLNLGVYHNPNKGEKASFLTTEYNQQITDFFSVNKDIFLNYRTSYALTLELTFETIQQIKTELKNRNDAADFSTRAFSRLNPIKDLQIYSQLVNDSMIGHFMFFPIKWEIMKQLLLPLILFIVPKYFRFILKNNSEIGFVFAIPDYNEILSDRKSDMVNFFYALINRRKITKARIIYSCLQSGFQGQKLIKIARHQVLIDLYNDGFTSVESSYVDEENQKSISNVKSTGAKIKQNFYLYKIQNL